MKNKDSLKLWLDFIFYDILFSLTIFAIIILFLAISEYLWL